MPAGFPQATTPGLRNGATANRQEEIIEDRENDRSRSILPELLAANQCHAGSFSDGHIPRIPVRGLVILTCMDTRVLPLKLLGLADGDAHVLRNAGARVTPDIIRSLVVSHDVLGTRELLIIHHTGCGLFQFTEEELRDLLHQRGCDAINAPDFMTFSDHTATLEHDISLLRASPLIPDDLPISGHLYHVETGVLEQLV